MIIIIPQRISATLRSGALVVAEGAASGPSPQPVHEHPKQGVVPTLGAADPVLPAVGATARSPAGAPYRCYAAPLERQAFLGR